MSALLLAVMVSISFMNVLTRNAGDFSLAFTEELTVYLFVWMTVLGAALAFKTGTNMYVAFLNEKFPKSARRVLYIFSTALTVIFFAVLCYLGCIQVYDEMILEAKTESIYMPLWYFSLAVPLGSCLIIVRALGKAAQVLRGETY
jgi:TRAP-type C4-dicarboxylate transport system permease small subunit